MTQIRRYFLSVFLLICIILQAICGYIQVKADDPLCSLSLTKAVSGSTFELYQIQLREADGTYTTTKDFAKYPINLKLTNSDEMRAAASTLESYIIADKPAAYATAKASADGKVSFSGLPAGLYVALAGTYRDDKGVVFEQSPVIAYLPASSEDQRTVYDLVVEVKSSKKEEKTKYEVRKVWKDDEADGKAESRPKEIEVSIYQNKKAKPYATVKLNKENNWTYTWEDLEGGHKYSVKENTKVKGYTVKITDEAGIFTICNTKDEPEVPSPPLPQTGQLWWPVAILAILGAVFLAIGMSGKSDHKK